MKTNNNMELRERINRILQVSYNSKKSHYDVTDEILSEIGICGECENQKYCGIKNAHFVKGLAIKIINHCSAFERREK